MQHDITYEEFKHLNRRTAADKVSCDKAFNFDKNLKYDGYQRGLASMVLKTFVKKRQVEQLKMKLYLIKK